VQGVQEYFPHYLQNDLPESAAEPD